MSGRFADPRVLDIAEATAELRTRRMAPAAIVTAFFFHPLAPSVALLARPLIVDTLWFA